MKEDDSLTNLVFKCISDKMIQNSCWYCKCTFCYVTSVLFIRISFKEPRKIQSFFLQIFDSIHCFRVFWLGVIFAATGLFAFLTIQKLIYLSSYPTNVNLDVTHKDAMPFPAVTLCNQNQYRFLAFISKNT